MYCKVDLLSIHTDKLVRGVGSGGGSHQLAELSAAVLEGMVACPEAAPLPAQAGPLLPTLLCAACRDASNVR